MKKIKFKYIILFLIPILFFIQYNLRIDNDFWFTIKEGEYVINNGFPNVVPFTIYDNLNFIYQSYEPEGRGFESLLVHQNSQIIVI